MGSYVFKNAFHYREWPQGDAKSLLISQVYTNRMEKLNLGYGVRSKTIVRPGVVKEMGTHSTFKLKRGKGSKISISILGERNSNMDTNVYIWLRNKEKRLSYSRKHCTPAL